MNTYKGLSTYLNNSFNENLITEGLFDFFGKGSNGGNKEQTSVFSGIFGRIGAMFKPVNKKSTNPFMKAMQEIAHNEMEDEKTRLKKEMEAEDNAEIAKLKAEYAYNRKQMELRSQKRVQAFNAIERQANDFAERAKKINLLYTPEQNQKMISQLHSIGKELKIADNSPAKRMQELATTILIKEDGTGRNMEEVNKIFNAIKDNGDLDEGKLTRPENMSNEEWKKEIEKYKIIAKNIKEYNSLAEKNSAVLVDGIKSDAFKEDFIRTQIDIVSDKDIKAEIEEAEEGMKAFNETTEIVKKINQYNKTVDEAKSNLDSYKKSLLFKETSSGDIEQGEKNDFIEKLKEIANDESLKEDGGISVSKLKNKLKELGFPEELATKLSGGESAQTIDAQVFKDAIDRNNDDIDGEVINKVFDTQKTKYDDLKTKNAAPKKIELEEGTDIDDIISNIPADYPGKDDLVAGLKKLKGKDANGSEVSTISSGLAEDIKANRFDGNSAEYKAAKAELEKKVKAAQKLKEENDKAIKANKAALEEASKSVEERRNNDLPPETLEKIEKKVQGLEEGEEINGEKIGIRDPEHPNEFIEKPGPNASEKEQLEYIKKRNAILFKKDVSSESTATDPDIVGVKYDENKSKYYQVNKDGTEKEIDETTAIAIRANKLKAAQSKALILNKKQRVIDAIKSCINKEGKFDEAKLKAIIDNAKKDGANLSDIELVENLRTVLNSDNPSKYFKGIDTGDGNFSADEIKKLVDSDAGKELKTELQNFDEEEAYKNRDKSKDNDPNATVKWEDVEDEDEELNTDEKRESDEEDEENAKNDNGEKLVKGDDGKWYKESDIDENGKPKSDATPQENKSKKTLENPAKIWKRKKRKNGTGTTKSYYNKKDESISAAEYKEKVEAYKRAKKKQSQKPSQQADSIQSKGYTSLSNYLLEKFNR